MGHNTLKKPFSIVIVVEHLEYHLPLSMKEMESAFFSEEKKKH